MTYRTAIGTLLLGSLLGVCAVAGAQPYSTIDFPGASATLPSGINSSGDIVGAYTLGGVARGFLLSRGTFTSIDYPGALETDAIGINSKGDVCGFFRDASLQWHGFVFSDGAFTVQDNPIATTGTFTLGNNARGTLVGEHKIGQAFGQLGFAWLLSDGEYTQLVPPDASAAFATSINSREDVVGRLIDTTGHQLAWKLDKINGYTVFGYPGATLTNARGINARGEIVGVYNLAGVNHGFLLSSDDFGNFVTIDFPGAATTRALGINAAGDIVGTYTLPGSPAMHGFLLQND
jgi:probable HAF family extracellular repeat protein